MSLIQTLKDLGGYWHYEGGRYLAKLTSGKISDTFCDTGVLTCKPKKLSKEAERLIHMPCPDGADEVDTFAVRYAYKDNIYVCGPAMGGVTLAYEIARQLGATAIWFNDAGKPSQPIPLNATVLLVTDHIKHGVQHIRTEEFVDYVGQHLSGTNQILPYILCLVDSSCADTVEVKVRHPIPNRAIIESKLLHIIPLARVSVTEFDSIEEAQLEKRCVKGYQWDCDDCSVDHCPHCGMKFFEAVKPEDNWHKLTGDLKGDQGVKKG